MNTKITYLTNEQNSYFANKAKMDSSVVILLSTGYAIFYLFILLMGRLDLMRYINEGKFYAIIPAIFLPIAFIYSLMVIHKCKILKKAIKNGKNLFSFGTFEICEIDKVFRKAKKINNDDDRRKIYFFCVRVVTATGKSKLVKISENEFNYFKDNPYVKQVILGKFAFGAIKIVYPLNSPY